MKTFAQSRSALFVMATFVGWLGSSLPSKSETIYSVVGGLSTKSNPNGVWTYLIGSTLLTSEAFNFGGVKHWVEWYENQSPPNSAAILRNRTGAPINYLTIVDPTSALEMDPESHPDVAVRFTAPTTGSYDVRGRFMGTDTGEHAHPVVIQHNGTTAFAASIAAYGQVAKFNIPLQLVAGDTVDVLCETGSTYNYLSTGLTATITAR